MPKVIPSKTKQDILFQFLQGHSFERIAKDNDISTGTVSNIIEQARKSNIPDIEFLRTVSVFLRKEALSLEDLATSIRLRKILDVLKLPEDDLESIIEQIGIHCFKNPTMSSEEFLYQINEVCTTVSTYDCSLNELPDIIIEKEEKIKRLDNEIWFRERNFEQLFVEYGVTAQDLYEYRRSRPLVDRIIKLQHTLQEKERKMSELQKDLFFMKMDYGMEQYKRAHPEEVAEYEAMVKAENNNTNTHYKNRQNQLKGDSSTQ